MAEPIAPCALSAVHLRGFRGEFVEALQLNSRRFLGARSDGKKEERQNIVNRRIAVERGNFIVAAPLRGREVCA